MLARSPRRPLGVRLLAAVVLVALPVLLVVPFHPEAWLYGDALRASPRIMRPVVWIVVEWGGNIAAFAVFVIALRAFVRRTVFAFAIGCATSAVLELAQVAIPDRVPSLGDVALNCTGAALGAAVLAVAAELRRASLPASTA